ncbi:MAG: RagB/SusD family nutrient uptake outer membrane protein [Lutimonas sp.]
MKKIYSIIMMAGLFFTSCETFLEEDNLSNVTAESFYVTAEGFEALVNANYALMKDIYGGDPYTFCAGTDMYSNGRVELPQGIAEYLTLNPGDSEIEPLYENCYNAIAKANMGLYYSEITDQTSTLNTRIGELKYLRANAYFLLVQTYGGVGIITDFIDSPILSFDRNSAEEVYSFILTELNDALNLVSDGGYNGRVNKRAVQHMLAKVHLTRGYESFGSANDFDQAASYADQAIAGQGLNIPFGNLWEPGNEMNAEVLFSVQYSSSAVSTDPQNLGHKQSKWFGSYMGGSENAGNMPYRLYSLIATDYTLDLFEETDTRWEGTFMTEIFTRYYDYYDVDVADHDDLTVRDFYEPKWFTQADRDNYKAAHPGVNYHDYGTHSSQLATSDFQLISCRKFDDPTEPFSAGSNSRTSTRDIILSRLGETYLIAAEAYYKAGNDGLALERLNEVRRRANVPDVLAIDIEVILDERARELFGEYHRWFDLKRTGTLVRRASLYNYRIDEANFAGANGELKILRPIPQSALDLNQNKDFPQNPAYN